MHCRKNSFFTEKGLGHAIFKSLLEKLYFVAGKHMILGANDFVNRSSTPGHNRSNPQLSEFCSSVMVDTAYQNKRCRKKKRLFLRAEPPALEYAV